MNRLGDVVRWWLIGGPSYPDQVERVLSGEMQARYAHTKTRKDQDLLVHPDYMFMTVAQTKHAIRGAFTLRLVGLEGMTSEAIEEYGTSDEQIPNLELLNNQAMTYRQLGVVGGARFLKIAKLVEFKDGAITPRDTGAQMLEAHPEQAYTVFPEELRKPSGVDIGGENLWSPDDQTSADTAARVLDQYSPYYQHLRPID